VTGTSTDAPARAAASRWAAGPTGTVTSERPASPASEGRVPPATAPGRAGASLSVPRAVLLADVLLAPADGVISPEDLTRLRDALGRDLQAVAADLPPGERLRLDAFAMRTARRHPERCAAGNDSFTPSPRTCRRAVGVAAVARCVRGVAPGPVAAVADVLDQGVDDLGAPGGASRAPWWAGWYAGLPRGARAVVQAEATTWATRLLTALEWRRFPRPAVVGGRDDWWQCPGGPQLTLQGRAEVRVQADRRLALLVVGSGRCPEDWRLELGFPGLVAALVRDAAAAPCRVVGVWPDSGQVRVLRLDVAALEATATAVVSAVGTWVDARIDAGHGAHGGAA